MVDVSEVERRAEIVKTNVIGISPPAGSVLSTSVNDFIEMAKLYARAGVMVPPHCRDKPGVCFALCKQAADWGIPDLAVMNKSYVVNNRGVERIAYESQLIHALIEKNAPLVGRLRCSYSGAGDERRCKVWGTLHKNGVKEETPHEYESETLGKLRDARGRNEHGMVKGSPLWDQQPDVQLFYSTSRTWARMWCPDVILGVYTPEDPQYEPKDVTPELPAYLKRMAESTHSDGRGFDLERVRRESAKRNTIIEGAAEEETPDGDRSDGDVIDHGQRDSGGREGGAVHDQGPAADAGAEADGVGAAPTGQEETGPPQQDIFPAEAPPKPKGKRK